LREKAPDAVAQGKHFLDRGEFGKAAEVLKLAVRESPDDLEARRLLAEAYIAMLNRGHHRACRESSPGRRETGE